MFRRSTKKKIVLTLQFPGERCPGNPEFGPEVCIALPRIVPPRSRAQDLLVEFINHLSLITWLVFSKIYPNKKWILLQVFSGLFCLRQHSVYQASSSVLSLKPMANFDDPGGQTSSSNCTACHNKNLYLKII